MRISDWSSDVCSSDLAVFDISQAKSKQWSQEFRLQSAFDGPFNFSLGANYTRFKTLNDYYVMSNMFTALAYGSPFNTQSSDGSFPNNQFVPGFCTQGAWNVGNGMIPAEEGACPYVEPNPVEGSEERRGGQGWVRTWQTRRAAE